MDFDNYAESCTKRGGVHFHLLLQTDQAGEKPLLFYLKTEVRAIMVNSAGRFKASEASAVITPFITFSIPCL